MQEVFLSTLKIIIDCNRQVHGCIEIFLKILAFEYLATEDQI